MPGTAGCDRPHGWAAGYLWAQPLPGPALTRRLAVCSLKFKSMFKTCPEVFGEGESASEEPDSLVDSPDIGWVSVGEDPLGGAREFGDVVENHCLLATTTARRRSIPRLSNGKELSRLAMAEIVPTAALVKMTKTTKTDHFYLSGQSDRPPGSQPEEDLLKQPTRNTRHFRTPGKRPIWGGFLLPKKSIHGV